MSHMGDSYCGIILHSGLKRHTEEWRVATSKELEWSSEFLGAVEELQVAA